MASWNGAATISTYLTLNDLSNASNDINQAHQRPILKLVAESRSKGYDSICIPLTTENWKKRWSDMCLLRTGSDRDMEVAAERQAEVWRSRPGFLKDEVTMTQLDEAEGVSIMVSEWLELDAVDDWIRHDAEIALQQELAYASYLNVQSAILPPPRNREHVASYARTVNSCLSSAPYINLSVRLPVYNPSVLQANSSTPIPNLPGSSEPTSPSPGSAPRVVVSESSPERISMAPESELNKTWEMWDLIRTMCDYNTRLTLTLDLALPLPSTLGVLSKWGAESVRNIFIPSSSFIANTKGYPVLPKPTQNFIRDCMIHRPNVILSDLYAGRHARGGEMAYSQYIRHLEKTSPAVQAAQKAGTVENFAQGYQDYLQAPLQPLMDNLQSVTYQTFEQDPVKYRQYEEAMYRALIDRPADKRFIICIAGAGRGPLVARCLNALRRAQREADIFAIEKNQNAYVTLQHRKEREWGNKVTLLFGDMRFVDVPELADIFVSELLGSFGDNELSPECLDGAMRFLKPDGISIPSSYASHLAPLSSSKLYNEARYTKDVKGLETPYVVMFQAVNILSGDGGGPRGTCGPRIQECWEFEHPRRDPVLDSRGLPTTNSHNARSAKLNFYIPHAGVLHGLAGYFEAVLYDNVGLSIHPDRKDHVSPDMLSWFPLYFPFKEPLYLPSNSELHVSIWRLTSERQVWYEWHAESFLCSASRVASSESPSNGSSLASAPSLMNLPSPTADALDNPFLESRSGREDTEEWNMMPTMETVKIGQTSLHNPGGRSSWIGL